MDFLSKIENIKKLLAENKYEDYCQEILNLQLSGGTGGEVFVSVCSKLLELKKQDIKAFELVKKDAEELIAYAKSIDYLWFYHFEKSQEIYPKRWQSANSQK